MSETELVERMTRVTSYRGRFYVILRNGAVQRWAASNLPVGRDYSTLTATLWRKAGHTGNPVGADYTTAGQTYYFSDEADAERAAAEFLTQLQAKGVKI